MTASATGQAGPAPLRAALAVLALVAAIVLAGAPVARAQDAPSVKAPSAILVEPATGDIVFQRKADDRRPIASTTKLMTALLTLESASLDDVMTAIDYRAAPVESQIGLRAGERLTVRDLLRGLLLASANDAAATLAVRVAGSRSAFVRRMNTRAEELGLRDTHFLDPIGLRDDAYSSATDLVKLTLILRRNAFFRETTNLRSATLRSGARRRTIVNRNTLVRTQAFVNGVKTGRTQRAGYVLVGSATRRGVTVLSAVLGDQTEADRDRDTLALLRYGVSRYRVRTAVREDEPVARADLEARDESVDLVAARTVRRTARVDERVAVRTLGAPKELDGPLPRGARVGTVEVRLRGKVVDRVPLVTAREVDAATFGQRFAEWLGRGSTVLLLAAFAACSLLLVLLRRRATRRRQGERARPPASVA
ncbi:D-alanyl-D-alanine carboxypeptidase family protein [Conexibacter sp. SYSU D00693]|uniref:D-alanyl-D-alanine carboxypeptidase family protein n=1 Tax=Conexibacter sp. SYSU D00693 TaxID=2812560 RepID=UPI00196AC8AA|nr:D-alanyl-D-alanine carboxypeptidase family protein [Conexibacter sp. SYSU D00693]